MVSGQPKEGKESYKRCVCADAVPNRIIVRNNEVDQESLET